MAQPTAYNRQASFSNIQATNPRAPLPGNTLDAELNAVKATIDEILTNIALIQRDDGALANASVGLDQLSEEIEVGWEAPEVWVTATAYVVGNTVFNGSGFYRCLVAHTAGTFATDLAASKWELIVDLSDLTIVDASQIANTPAGSIAATTVQAAINELASEKAATSHTHTASAISDSTADGRALLMATLAQQQTLLGLDALEITELPAQLALSGIIEPAALASDQNDWAPNGIAAASTIRMSASAAVNITGIDAPDDDGTVLVLENVGTIYPITLLPSNTGSVAANRFLFQAPVVVGPNQSVVLKYDEDSSVPRWRLFDRGSRLPYDWISGLKTSNAVGDATNDITIQPGEAYGTLGRLNLVLTSALTKQLDADWAAGNNAGGRYVSSANNPAIAADTTYHLHLIGKADGTVDAIFYTGVDPSAILPTGYIDYRNISSHRRVSTSLELYTQEIDGFFRVTTPGTASPDVTNLSSTATAYTIASPLGLSLRVKMNFYVAHGSDSVVYIRCPLDTDATPSKTVSPLGQLATNAFIAGELEVYTNTSAQIEARATAANTTLRGAVVGWFHPRGKRT